MTIIPTTPDSQYDTVALLPLVGWLEVSAFWEPPRKLIPNLNTARNGSLREKHALRTFPWGRFFHISQNSKVKMKIVVLLFGIIVTTVVAVPCPEQARPHATRCDQYFRCVLLPSKTHVWVPTQCGKGLIFEPQLKTCVLPGDNWECNLSSETGYESGENVYGINNLPALYTDSTTDPIISTTTQMAKNVTIRDHPGYSKPDSFTDRPVNLPTVSGDNKGYYIVLDRDGNKRITYYHTPAPSRDEDEESSGDGPDMPTTATYDTRPSTSSGSSETTDLTPNELNSFLADYTFKTTSEFPSKLETKLPLPANGRIHPEHLSVILSQQEKLKKIASQMKLKADPTGGVGDKSPFSHQPVYTSRPKDSYLINLPQKVPQAAAYPNSALLSDDVIQSIIKISKQMMTNHDASLEEFYMKPVFIPISITSGSQDYSKFPSKPGQAPVYDTVPEQVVTSRPQYHNNYQQLTEDVVHIGNRFPPRPISNDQVYPHHQQIMSAMPAMNYPMYNQQNYPNSNQMMNQQGYYNPTLLMNQLRQTLSYNNGEVSTSQNAISEEQDDNSEELPEKEMDSYLNFGSNEETEDESNTRPDMKKLISVGGATLNYEDYKDSILPLLDANPDEVRISILTCTLGSRQPNKTDCTKYYVCNPNNGAFQSFSCPSYTAFNENTRICDTATYKACHATKRTTPKPTALTRLAEQKLKNHLTTETSQLKHDLKEAQKYVDLIKREAYKILSRNKMTSERHDAEVTTSGITSPALSSITTPFVTSTSELISSTKRTSNKPKRKSGSKKRNKNKTTTTGKPVPPDMANSTTTPKPVPRAPKCKQNGKMADPAVRRNYYVCYKASPKKFIKTRMACPNALVYCPSTEYCVHEKDCKK
ncbi:uncharacterized protein LOC129772948 [Toxorhynchites rutilus septentrionalis]|uniref:uncharacterized protein LOC129772948 n=1 Tax=Toxorhynchites rutilus septentrionalis TaxID=329112 RepID=UPI002478748A|nr:uncharacterized protein LOC129772948 [Toxorhynchites rutilus septentrionalis]